VGGLLGRVGQDRASATSYTRKLGIDFFVLPKMATEQRELAVTLGQLGVVATEGSETKRSGVAVTEEGETKRDEATRVATEASMAATNYVFSLSQSNGKVTINDNDQGDLAVFLNNLEDWSRATMSVKVGGATYVINHQPSTLFYGLGGVATTGLDDWERQHGIQFTDASRHLFLRTYGCYLTGALLLYGGIGKAYSPLKPQDFDPTHVWLLITAFTTLFSAASNRDATTTPQQQLTAAVTGLALHLSYETVNPVVTAYGVKNPHDILLFPFSLHHPQLSERTVYQDALILIMSLVDTLAISGVVSTISRYVFADDLKSGPEEPEYGDPPVRANPPKPARYVDDFDCYELRANPPKPAEYVDDSRELRANPPKPAEASRAGEASRASLLVGESACAARCSPTPVITVSSSIVDAPWKKDVEELRTEVASLRAELAQAREEATRAQQEARADDFMDRRRRELCSLGDAVLHTVADGLRERSSAISTEFIGRAGAILHESLAPVVADLQASARSQAEAAVAEAITTCQQQASDSLYLVLGDCQQRLDIACTNVDSRFKDLMTYETGLDDAIKTMEMRLSEVGMVLKSYMEHDSVTQDRLAQITQQLSLLSSREPVCA
jgi:hypothetical protein